MGKTSNLSPEDFVRFWVQAFEHNRSAKDIAKELGITKESVNKRAKTLRDIGVQLPDLWSSHRPFSERQDENVIASLNRYINQELERIGRRVPCFVKCGHPKAPDNVTYRYRSDKEATRICKICDRRKNREASRRRRLRLKEMDNL